MSSLIGSFCQVHDTVDVILAVLGSTGGLDVVRVALWYDTAGGNQSDFCMSHIFNSWIRIYSVEVRHWELGCEFLAGQLLNQHLYCSLRASLVLKEVDTDAVWHIALFLGRTKLLTLGKLKCQRSHGGNCTSHACCAVLGLNHIYFGLVHVSAWVLFVHTGQNRKV